MGSNPRHSCLYFPFHQCWIAMTTIHTHIHIEHNDTIKTSDTVLYKNIPLTLFEKVVCERELETEQNCNILTPTLLAITAFLSRSPGLLNRGPGGPASLGAGFLYRILSPTRLIPNWLNFLCTELYNSSTSTFFLWASQFRTHSTCPRSRL